MTNHSLPPTLEETHTQPSLPHTREGIQQETGLTRRAATVKDGYLHVDENELDIYCEPYQSKENFSYNADVHLTPYDELDKLYIDIETLGLDPLVDRVIMIGLRRGKENVIISNRDERQMIVQLLNYLSDVPDILVGHNHVNFDLPFLTDRAKLYGLAMPWQSHYRTSRITSASVNGQPIEYTPVYWDGVDIIDTYQQIAVWDKSAAKLDRYDLKSSVIALKLREDRRLELGVKEIRQYWESNDHKSIRTISDYLVYDLVDTELLADFLLPTVYYQLMYVPDMTFQQISVANARKHENIYRSLYPERCLELATWRDERDDNYFIRNGVKYKRHDKEIEGVKPWDKLPLPVSDEKVKYYGGLSELWKPGLHHNVAKMDVNSMYPNIMLRYGLCSYKDWDKRSLVVLKSMTDERLKLKELAKQGDKQANYRQNALKILINSFYGFLGTGYYNYNDMEAAALVTAVGRKILVVMIRGIENNGGTVISIDTDGVIYTSPDVDKTFEIVEGLLPSGITIELEYKNVGLYAPKAKNYVMVSDKGKVSCKGLFGKRNRYPLQNQHPLEVIRLYFMESQEAATIYHQQTCIDLKIGVTPIEQLSITRRIGKAEKTLVESGIGEVGDRVSYWIAKDQPIGKKGQPLKPKKKYTNTDAYWREWYIDECNEVFNEIFPVLYKPLDLEYDRTEFTEKLLAAEAEYLEAKLISSKDPRNITTFENYQYAFVAFLDVHERTILGDAPIDRHDPNYPAW